MPRLRNTNTQVVVNVDDDTAARLMGDGWEKAEAEKPKQAAPKRTR